MQGLLLIDKPVSWTSFDVVNYVRKMVAQAEGKKPKNVKVGHTGTLDPFATGLLVLLVGKDYTKRAGELSKLDKVYAVTAELGRTSSTGDPEGEITKVSDKIPTLEEVQAVLSKFVGQLQQVPPAYSAVKVGGQRAYKLARAGKAVALEPRQVTVRKLELVTYDYPKIELLTEVSSGTYVRTLVEDVGRALGTSAYTTGLKRAQVGGFTLTDAVSLEEIKTASSLPLITL